MLNPFASFLATAENITNISIRATQYAALDPSRFEAYTNNAEGREYAADVISRVKSLSYCFNRLCELTPIAMEIHRAKRKNQTHPTGIDLDRVPPEILEQERRWKQEGETLTAFVIYELKSLTDMLRKPPWSVSIPQGTELKYLLAARDRFLAHPRFRGVARIAPANIAFPVEGGMANFYVVSRNSFDRIRQSHYLRILGLSEPMDKDAQRQMNKQLILSTRKNEKITDPEAARLKAFGIPDIDLEKSMQELGHLLEKKVLPIIKQYYDAAINDFGCERR